MPSRKEVFDLEATLPYLLNRAGVRIGNAFNAEMKRHRLSLQLWRALASLYHQSGQSVTELAAHTSIELSTVSRLIGAGVRRGMMRRRAGDDARTLRIELTAAGRALTERIIPLARLYEQVALAGFDPSEVALLKRMLDRIYVNIAGVDPTGRGRVAHRGAPRARGSATRNNRVVARKPGARPEARRKLAAPTPNPA